MNNTRSKENAIVAPYLWVTTPPSLCYSKLYWTLFQVLIVIIFVMIAATNVILILIMSLGKNKHINCYLFNSLSISNLLIGLLVVPVSFGYTILDKGNSNPGKALCAISGTTFDILQTVSLFSFFGLSVDCYLSISFPYKYVLLANRRNNRLAVLVIWLIPILMYGVIPTTGLGFYVYRCWMAMCNMGYVDLNYLSFAIIVKTTVFLSTYGFNTAIFYEANKSDLQRSTKSFTERGSFSTKVTRGTSLKASKSILVALILFTLCWGPYYAALSFVVLLKAVLPPVVEFMAVWIAVSNSFMNLFVFLVTLKLFRNDFKHLILRSPEVYLMQSTSRNSSKSRRQKTSESTMATLSLSGVSLFSDEMYFKSYIPTPASQSDIPVGGSCKPATAKASEAIMSSVNFRPEMSTAIDEDNTKIENFECSANTDVDHNISRAEFKSETPTKVKARAPPILTRASRKPVISTMISDIFARVKSKSQAPNNLDNVSSAPTEDISDSSSSEEELENLKLKVPINISPVQTSNEDPTIDNDNPISTMPSTEIV